MIVQGADAEQGEVAVGRQEGDGRLVPAEGRQVRVEGGDARGLGEIEGQEEGVATGGGARQPDGRLGVVGEGGLPVPAEDEGLQQHTAREGGGGHGHGDLETADCEIN